MEFWEGLFRIAIVVLLLGIFVAVRTILSWMKVLLTYLGKRFGLPEEGK